MATVSVSFSFYTDFENFTILKPNPQHEARATMMLDQLIAWANALAAIRR